MGISAVFLLSLDQRLKVKEVSLFFFSIQEVNLRKIGHDKQTNSYDSSHTFGVSSPPCIPLSDFAYSALKPNSCVQ